MDPTAPLESTSDRRPIPWRRWALAIAAAAVVFVVFDLVVIVRLNDRLGLALGFVLAIAVAVRVGRPDGLRQWAALSTLSLLGSVLALGAVIVGFVTWGADRIGLS